MSGQAKKISEERKRQYIQRMGEIREEANAKDDYDIAVEAERLRGVVSGFYPEPPSSAWGLDLPIEELTYDALAMHWALKTRPKTLDS